MTAASPMRVSLEEYLELEARSPDVKHEWHDGVVYAMSRGTPEHARLTFRITQLLLALEKTCQGYAAGAMLYIERAKLSTYADAFVVCGALETKNVMKNGRSLGEAVTNPTVIVEVLSDSTERYDRDGKFQAYKQIASLEEYVLVGQYEPLVEVYRRQPSGEWTCATGGPGTSFIVHGAELRVDELYAGALTEPDT
ncbi:MAG: Uma2 family endonuclease [Polyangiaceae bacterium]